MTNKYYLHIFNVQDNAFHFFEFRLYIIKEQVCSCTMVVVLGLLLVVLALLMVVLVFVLVMVFLDFEH